MITSPVKVAPQPYFPSFSFGKIHSTSIFDLSSLPCFIRFRQCIGDFFTTRNPRHLANGFKYFTSFPVIYMSFILSGSKHPSNASFQVYWIIALTVNFVISCLWDVLVDWDLGHRQDIGLLQKTKPKPFLRSQLLYRGHYAIYYSAILFNTLVRGLWIFRIYFIVMENHGALNCFDSPAGMVVLQALELTRRFIWLIFRVEVQALNENPTKSPLSLSAYNIGEIN